MTRRRAVLAAAAALAAVAALGGWLARPGLPTAWAAPPGGPTAPEEASAGTVRAVPPAGPGFEFVALGDMPYGADATAGAAYRHLIGQINALKLPLTLHVGDFKSGLADCGDAEYRLQFQNFQLFDRALVYTPGDNDWFDCQRRGDDPLERLQVLRQHFFAAPQSLGRQPVAVLRQSDVMPAFALQVENLRWSSAPGPGAVMFASFHTVGPDNGTDAPSAALRAEAAGREAANAAWIRAAFATARQQGAAALVLVTQAETLVTEGDDWPSRGEVRKGFALSISQTLLPLADAAPFPVLLVHGDTHRYTVDRPFRNRQGQTIANLWRLQVFGEPRLHAVRVWVNLAAPPASAAGASATAQPPFAFTPIWNPLSPDPRLTRRIQP